MKKSFVLLFLSFTLALASCGLRGRGGESNSLSNDTSESQVSSVSEVKESKDTKGTFTVEWVNPDGEKLEVDKDVPYGTMAEYNGPTPEYPDVSLRDQYVFAKWDPTPSIVTEDITYHAKYKTSDRIHITFDLNGGDSPSYKPEGIYIDYYDPSFFFFDVTKEGYDFRGWQCEGRQIFDEFGNNTNSYPHTSIKERTFTAMFDEAGNVSDSDLLNNFIMFSFMLDKNYITSVNLFTEKDNILSIHTQNYVWYREYEIDPSGNFTNSGGILQRPDNGMCSHYYIAGDNLVLTESMSEEEYNTSSYNQSPSFINCEKYVVTNEDPYDGLTKKAVRIEDKSVIRELIDTNARCGSSFISEVNYMDLIPYGEGDISNVWECVVHYSHIDEQKVNDSFIILFISLYEQEYDIPQVVDYLNDRTAILSEEAIQVASIFDNICSYKNYTLNVKTSFAQETAYGIYSTYDGNDYDDMSLRRVGNYNEIICVNDNSYWKRSIYQDEIIDERYLVSSDKGSTLYVKKNDGSGTYSVIDQSHLYDIWEVSQSYTVGCLSLDSNNYIDTQIFDYVDDGSTKSCIISPIIAKEWTKKALNMSTPGYGLLQGRYTEDEINNLYDHMTCAIVSTSTETSIRFMSQVGTNITDGVYRPIFFVIDYVFNNYGTTPENVIPTVS